MNKNACPICGFVQSHPAWNCMQGHVICSKCCKNSNACPVCTSSSISCIFCEVVSSDLATHLQTSHNFEGIHTSYSIIKLEVNANLSTYSLHALHKLLLDTEEKVLAIDLSIKDEFVALSVYNLKKQSDSLRFAIKNKSSENQILCFSETGAEPFYASLKQIKDYFTYTNPSGTEVFCIEIDLNPDFLYF